MRKIGFLLAGALALSSCGKAKEGDSCTDPQCEDSKTAFFCEDGHYRAIPCPGPQGCFAKSNNQNWIICDINGVKAGDACPDEYKLTVLCQGGTSALVCNGTSFIARDCQGSCQSGRADEGGSCP